MTALLNIFYQLPLNLIAQYFAIISLAYLLIRKHLIHSRCFRFGICGILILWIAATVWVTVFSRSPRSVYPPEYIPFHSYRKLFASGNTEIFRSNFMNIALFYPGGLLAASLLPEKWPRRQKALTVLLCFALFSVMIEYAQFRYALGESEIDDVIHNTFGAFIGALPIVWQDILHRPSPQVQ